MKRISFILINLTFFLLLYGQTTTNDPLKAPEYIPPSPEAAAFAKYGDVPVSEYTGTPNIDIPIYTVKSGSLSLPISLNYHATGIQVNQEATWVGLGWNLIAGGCINYVPIGGNEQLSNYSTTWIDRLNLLNNFLTQETGSGIEDHRMMWGGHVYNTYPDNTYPIQDDALRVGMYGFGQPDVYSVSFLNKSFRFFIHPKNDSIIFLGKKTKCVIAKLGNNLSNGFVITEENGVKYFFTSTEMDDNQRSCQAWYLTSIISPDGHYIKLNYSNFGVINTIPTFSENDCLNYPGYYPLEGPNRIRNVGYNLNILYLTSIETENEIVNFDLVAGRIDVSGNGARKLQAIRVIDKLENKEILRDSLNYDYFNASNIGGDYTTDDNFYNGQSAILQSYISNRLKLTKLIHYDINATRGEVYSFAYNDSIQLPMKTSFARDYWGFYNGQENRSSLMPNNAQHTLIPSYNDLLMQNTTPFILPSQYQQYPGANRRASANYIGAEMLKSIQYPTGGKTVFTFEPHTFSNQNILAAEDQTKMITHPTCSVFIVNGKFANDTISFTIDQPTIANFSGNIHGIGVQHTYPLDSLKGTNILVIGPLGPNPRAHTYSISTTSAATFAQNGYSQSWNDTLHLAPGKYVLKCSLSVKTPDYSELVSAEISYDNINKAPLITAYSIGGGVRVRTIINYDENNKIVMTKKYTYNGGVILAPMNNIYVPYLYNSNSGIAFSYSVINGLAFKLSSENYTLPTSDYIGINGYNQVQIQTLSGSNTDGTEIVNFQNTPSPGVFFNVPLFVGYSSNGEELSRIYLNASNDTVHTEKYKYSQGDTYGERINYIVNDNYIGSTNDLFTYPDHLNQNFNVFFLNGYQVGDNKQAFLGRFSIGVYSNKNFWDYLSKKEETDYFGTNKVTKTTSYTYNPTNYCVSQTAETRSDGHIKRTVLKYPNDFPKTVCDSLTSLHIINPVIVDSTYLDSKFLERVKTNYISQPGGFYHPQYGGVLKPYSVESQIGNNASKIRIQYAKYDSHYNPVYIIQNEAVFEVYLWSYNYQYPVVKIEGLTYAQVTNIFPQTSMEILASTPNPTADMLNSIRSAFAGQNALITTYTYQPLIGISTATAPNGVVTTYKYDSFNRLWYLKDNNGNNILNNQYHYGNH